MISKLIGIGVGGARDRVARGLIRVGLRPNHITVLGMFFTIGAGIAIAAGRDHWRPWAVSLMVAAGACDLLDGAMANVGGLRTRFGAVLDSTCDRVSDAALYFGIAFYYVTRPQEWGTAAPNVTLALLAAAGLLWAYLTSYIRARAANEGADAGGGFWQRGERVVTLLVGLGFHHLPTAVWILGLAPLATVAHRLWQAWRTCVPAAQAATAPAPGDGPSGLWGIRVWRWKRGSIPFDIQAGATIAVLVFWDLPPIDPLRAAVARLIGA